VMTPKPDRNIRKISYDFELAAIPDDVTRAARKVAAAHARGPEERRLLLDILGLGPSTAQPPCTCLRCGREYARSGRGRASCFCSRRCYLETLEEERTARSRTSAHSPHPGRGHAPADSSAPWAASERACPNHWARRGRAKPHARLRVSTRTSSSRPTKSVIAAGTKPPKRSATPARSRNPASAWPCARKSPWESGAGSAAGNAITEEAHAPSAPGAPKHP
jgi:hypothetical protein